MIEHIFMRELSAGSKEAEQRLNDMVAEHGWEVVSWIPTEPPVPGRLPGGRWLLRRTVPGSDPAPAPLLMPADSMIGILQHGAEGPPKVIDRWLVRHFPRWFAE